MDARDNLYALLADRLATVPDAPVLMLPGGGTVAGGDLLAESARIARLLLDAGLEPGDRVAAQVDKSPEAVALYLGAIRAGLVWMPLNPAYTRDELAFFLGDAEPRAWVCAPEREGELAGIAPGARRFTLGRDGAGSLVTEARARPARAPIVPREGGDLAALLYTSGTTGRPKGAMLTHRNLASNATVLVGAWEFGEGDVLLHALPIFHVHGLFVATHCALLSGAPILFEPRFEPLRALDLLPRATVFMGVPTYYTRLLAEPRLGREACAGMRLFFAGSAPLLPDTFRAFRERTGHAVLERYGMTETGMLCSNPVRGERRPGSVGLPLPGVALRIVDGEDLPLPSGEVGHVQVRGDGVFPGYWRLPERTRAEFTADGWFRTGDTGERGEDGYVTLSGRAKDLVITGGLNVYPKEVEDVLDALPGVLESAVFGVPHPDFGEAVAAAVVLRPGWTPSPEELISRLRAHLAGFKIPKSLYFLPELPRNAMGKVTKTALRERFGSGRG